MALPKYPSKIGQIAKTAKATGAKIIGITDSNRSPLAASSDLLLLCSAKSMGFHNSISGVVLVTDYLISTLAIMNKDMVKKGSINLSPFSPK